MEMPKKPPCPGKDEPPLAFSTPGDFHKSFLKKSVVCFAGDHSLYFQLIWSFFKSPVYRPAYIASAG